MLQFEVTGVTKDNIVEILADGNVIGQATATDTTVDVTTDGSTKLTDGPHQFTAIQIAPDQTVNVTESGGTTPSSETADVPSFNSSAVELTVDTVAPALDFTPVTVGVVGVPYTCQVSVAADTAAP